MPLSAMLIPAALADRINAEIFILSLVCLLAYCGASIQNAIKDKDYILPDYAHYMVYILPILAFVFACTNIIILLTLISWILLGVIYNTIARRVIFGDISVLSLTHLAIPMISSSLLIGFSLKAALIAAAYICLLFILMGNMKNIKDTRGDKNRGYKTITTELSKGESIAKGFYLASILGMGMTYFIFNLSQYFIFIYGIILIISFNIIMTKNKLSSLNMVRMAFSVFILGFIISKTIQWTIIIPSIAYCFANTLQFKELLTIRGRIHGLWQSESKG